MCLSSGNSSNSPLTRIFLSDSLDVPMICITAVMASGTDESFFGILLSSER
ncbi:hypothetical protein GBA52_009052 [Prunus armeniaca]|nr:hypothetical protein GBA52_009052 [Prunus armeniaca]